jgi:hypothetical protein
MSVGDQKPCYTNLDSNNIHQLSHYSECNIKNVEPQVVCRMAHVLFTLFVNVCVYWCLTHIVFCFIFVFLCLVYPMLSVSLDCFCFVFLCLVYPMLPVSLDCFCFVFLCLVYPMLPVSLDCSFFYCHFGIL